MAIARLEKEEWQAYFDTVSKVLVGRRAEVEVDALSLGSQIEAEWLQLLGISYDPRNDVLEIALDGLKHLVERPREIYVDRDALALTSFEVVAGDDVRLIVKLREPLMLTAASGTRA